MSSHYDLKPKGTSDINEFAEHFVQAQDQIKGTSSRNGFFDLELMKQILRDATLSQNEFWILESRSSGQSLGRISAHLSPHHFGVGYFGFFEAQDFASAQILVAAATHWLRNRGIGALIGPVSLNTWLNYRFRIGCSDSSTQNLPKGPTFSFEPHHPPSYPVWFSEMGFRILEKYHSDGLRGLEGLYEATRQSFKNAVSRGYTFRRWDHTRFIEQDLPIVYELSMKSFENNFLFEPVSFDFFRTLYLPRVKSSVDLSLAFFVCDETGKEVGFFFSYIESGYFVMKTTAILPPMRGQQLSNALLHMSVQSAINQGLIGSVAALMREGIQSESYSKKEEVIWKNEYALFRKEIIL